MPGLTICRHMLLSYLSVNMCFYNVLFSYEWAPSTDVGEIVRCIMEILHVLHKAIHWEALSGIISISAEEINIFNME